MDRLTELRRYVSTAKRGIEIGPYHNPIAPRALGYNTINVDIFDAQELRRHAEKDNNIPRENLARIEEVDVIGSADHLQELIEARFGREEFDYLLSSHNLEHLPDPIRFLQACSQLLAVGGHLSMAIPDKRCCYDFYRPLTDVSEWLQAYHEKRTCPTPTQVFRHCAFHSLDTYGACVWTPAQWAGPLPAPLQTLEEAFAEWQRRVQQPQGQPYKDCHCWAFTPSSFELIVRDLQYLGFVDLEIVDIRGSDPDACEFYVHMVKRRDYVQYTRHEFYACRTRLMAQISSELAAPIVHHGRYYGVSLIKIA